MTEKLQHLLDGKSDAAKKEYASIAFVAHLYYDEGLLQPEIADRLYFSRSKVSRMLKQARALGIVEIKVNSLAERIEVLENLLKETFHLRDAVVVSNVNEFGSADYTHDLVLDFAASYLEDLLTGEKIIGITNGPTLETLIRKMNRTHDCYLQALQLMGSVSSTLISTESRQLVTDLLSKYPGTGHYLNAPLFIADDRTLNIILHDKEMQDSLQMMKNCDVCVTGIGAVDSFEEESAKWESYMTEEYYNELKGRAAGSICSQYYDLKGRVFDCTWNTHAVRMPLENIAKLPVSIGIAAGKNKVQPILGALNGHVINTLITDADTASAVLQAAGA